jgi:hypothetical protein
MAITLISNSVVEIGVPCVLDSRGADFLLMAAMQDAGTGNSPQEVVDGNANPNTWIRLTQQNAGDATGGVRIYYSIPTQTGATHSFTTNGTHLAQGFAAFSGVTQTSPFDQQVGSTTLTPGSLTPSLDNCLVITAYSQAGGSAGLQTPNDGFSVLGNSMPAGTWGGGLAYKVQTTAAASNPTWSGNFTTRESSVQVSFFSGTTANGASMTRAFII